MRWFTLLVASALCAGVVVIAATPVAATYPGESGRVAYTDASEIYTMNPDGSDRRRITFDGGVYVKSVPVEDFYKDYYTGSGTPRWSPDGSMLAFLHYAVDDTTEIRIVDPFSGRTEVVFADWHGTMISWSPDGKRIAYGDDRGVWIAFADGTGAQLVTTPTLGLWPNLPGFPSWIASVKWSPDGTRLAFVESTSQGYVAGGRYISTVRINGTDRHVDICRFDTDGRRSGFDWAPDGTTVLCEASEYPVYNDGIGSVRPDGTDLRILTEGHWPVWSPNGSAFLFFGDDGLLLSYDSAQGTTEMVESGFAGMELDWQPLPLIPQPVGLVDPSTGIWHLTRNDGSRMSFYFGNPGDTPMVGDWNCNGVDTPGLYRQSDGYVYLRNSNTQGNADVRFYFGNPGDVPIAGDFNGDGCDTVSLYRQTEGRVYIINKLGQKDGGLGAADYSFYFGNPGDKPFVGDFNGDRVDTVGLHRESTGLVYFRNSNTQGIADYSFYFGDPGDRLIAADWNHDGNDSPAIYRPTDRTFYLRYTNTQGSANEQFLWGWPHWLPVAGNFDAD